ncbi:aldehyde dehydrogenase family protein [Microbacterium murale]|uniref:Aldehyde dehydrogenase n=1 Tax=Microbacterium murale TaxID=1081040 RepID=A0ABQ1RH31_9MICO|nr:aldehyde dehydrogenase family protein [Microbacterium murale]GGD70159.1 putative aldehyde dehydrogenase [Microbacterium murale]
MQIPHSTELFLGSRWTVPASDDVTDVVSPTDGSVVARLPRPSIADADVAVESAREAFPSWSGLAKDERLDIVRRFCNALKDRHDGINTAWVLECGMTVQDAKDLTDGATEVWELALETAASIEFSELRSTSMGEVEIRHEGIGPTVVSVAFNGPHMQLALAIVPALIAGNTIIHKLPPENRLLGYFISEAADVAGFPVGVYSVIAGDAEVSAHLVEHPDVQAVHFTGGNTVGASIMRTVADRTARVVLELGGKSAAIIAADADLDQVVPELVKSWALYSGQICVALTRVIVARSIHDAFVDRARTELAKLRIGDPSDPTTEWGPLINARAVERAERYVSGALAAGATLAYGGARLDEFSEGHWFAPTVLTDVTNDMDVAQDDIFGPVFVVIPFDTIDEAIDLANDSKYGLAGAVFTSDPALGRDVARRVQTGSIAINGTFPRLSGPFGGMKQSGFGREGGPEAFFQLTNTKTIAV